MTTKGLKGDLEALPLLDTLHMLARYQKSGSLTLRTEADEITIYFHRGSVRSVTTNDASLRIGQVLVDQGFVTEEQVEQVLALQSAVPAPERLGDLLIQVGHVSPAQITRAVSAQLEAALVRVLSRSSGTFQYEPDSPAEDDATIVAPIDFEPLVLNATYLADKWLAEQKPADVETLPEELIDPEVLSRLSDSEREVMYELVEVYSGLHQLAWRIGLSARHYKQSVERLLEQVLIRMALESHEDEQTTGRTHARYERIILSREMIDPWILTDLPENARELLLHILNGVKDMHSLVQRFGRSQEEFSQAIEQLVEEELITIATLSGDRETPSETDEVIDESFRLADEGLPESEIRELSHEERQALIAVLNGAQTLREMSARSGLPMSVFRDGAHQLAERGLLHRAEPVPETQVEGEQPSAE